MECLCRIGSKVLYSVLGVQSYAEVARRGRLRWFRHGAVHKVCHAIFDDF